MCCLESSLFLLLVHMLVNMGLFWLFCEMKYFMLMPLEPCTFPSQVCCFPSVFLSIVPLSCCTLPLVHLSEDGMVIWLISLLSSFSAFIHYFVAEFFSSVWHNHFVHRAVAIVWNSNQSNVFCECICYHHDVSFFQIMRFLGVRINPCEFFDSAWYIVTMVTQNLLLPSFLFLSLWIFYIGVH